MNNPTQRLQREERREHVRQRGAAQAMRMTVTLVCAEGSCNRCNGGPRFCLCTCHDLDEEDE